MANALAVRAMRFIGGAVAVTGLAIGSAFGAAQPVLVNGGFETGDFTGWTGTGDTTFNGVVCGGGPAVFQGNCAAFFGPVGTTGGISQIVTGLLVGDYYTIGFAFQPDGGNPSSFSASFGGQTLLSLTNPPGSFLGPYTAYSFIVRATATSETLAFNFRDDPGFLDLDAVSAQVPEPATLALLGTGLMGLFFSRRRKAA